MILMRDCFMKFWEVDIDPEGMAYSPYQADEYWFFTHNEEFNEDCVVWRCPIANSSLTADFHVLRIGIFYLPPLAMDKKSQTMLRIFMLDFEEAAFKKWDEKNKQK